MGRPRNFGMNGKKHAFLLTGSFETDDCKVTGNNLMTAKSQVFLKFDGCKINPKNKHLMTEKSQGKENQMFDDSHVKSAKPYFIV